MPLTTIPLMNWFQEAQNELETFCDIGQQIPEKERQERGKRAIDAFHEVFTQLADELQLREKWGDTYCHIAPFSTSIIERSTKMNVDFTLGMSRDGWFIEAEIASPERIGHMKDDYWQHIVSLGALGKAELHDSGRPAGWSRSPETRKIVQHKGSLVFSIARDFTLLSAKPNGCSALGSIHITLPIESDEAAVTTFFRNSLASLYRSNYLLYRSAYVEERRFRKNSAIQESSNGSKGT